MKRFLFCLFFILILTSAYSQDGAPLLSHYNESRDLEDQNWAICQDDKGVMMFANRRGILTYDGQDEYGFIRIPVIPYSLTYNKAEKRVFVGGDSNYGYIERDEKGFYNYHSLSGDSAKTGIITKIVFTDSTVFFYSEKCISRHDIKTGQLTLRLYQKDNDPFTGMFITPKNVFINVLSDGLHRIEGDTLFPIVTGYLVAGKDVLFSLPYDDKLVLLGMNTGSLSLFDGIKFYYYQIKDNGYLKQSTLSEGLVLSDSLYAFSTLDGGALIVERKSGKLRGLINYQNGLPDDEVFAMGTDKANGLWLSHQYGLTRAELMLPVGNFSIYPGLKGNLITTLWHKGELYVATSEGVYYLSEVKNYTEEEILVRNEKLKVKPLEFNAGTASLKQQTQEVQKARKSILSRIFGKKTGESEQENEPAAARTEAAIKPEVVVSENQPAEPEYIRKKVTRISSVGHSFVKVAGISEKCKQLVPAGDKIIASTTRGLFLISNHGSKPLVTDRYINFVSADETGSLYWVASADGYFYVTPDRTGWKIVTPDRSFNKPLYSITSEKPNTIWAGSDNKAYRIEFRGDKADPIYREYKLNNEFPLRYFVDEVNDTLFLFTESGISYYSSAGDSLVEYGNVQSPEAKMSFVLTQPDAPWIGTGDDWEYLQHDGQVSNYDKGVLKIFNKITSISTDDNYLWVIDGDNQLFRIVRNRISSIKPDLELFFKSISNDKGFYFRLSEINFGRGENTIYFELLAPGYLKQNSVKYQHIVDKVMDNWSKWSTSSTISLVMHPGTYTLKVRAKDIWGNITEPKVLTFTIKRPFTKTTVFYFIISILFLSVIISIIWFRERQLQKENRILEDKVKERTAEIEAQKEEITSSIEYAGRIQMAMLPTQEHFNLLFRDHFVLFKPRDIVSGDFYWLGEDEKNIFFTVADCTGHGVPGAFMSTLGISTLIEIITNGEELHANSVLNLLREKIKNSLHQTGKVGEAADGMDVAFCILNKSWNRLEYSGAFNPLLIFQNGEVKEYRADRMPIGIYVGEKESFTNYEINIRSGDTVYLFSDGFTDQFGGPEGGKYKRSNLKKLLQKIYQLPMAEQKQILLDEFDSWRGGAEQIDDVTVMGIRL